MFWMFIFLGGSLISLQIEPSNCLGLGFDSSKRSTELSFSPRDGKGWGWGSDSSTFFDIALTALAFLSFGIFLLNLLCNALLYPTNAAATQLTNPGPILTMVTAGGGTGGPIITGASALGGRRKGILIRRRRPGRSLFTPEMDEATSATYLIDFITNSIETLSVKEREECELSLMFCEINKKSNVMPQAFRHLVPIISLSISNIGKLLGFHNHLPTHLSAIKRGLEGSNCQSTFSKCK